MRAFVFPGQGSQKIGMGAELAEASAAAREVFEEVDDALGQKLSQIMREGPEDALMLTENAQPAIMANAIAVLRGQAMQAAVPVGEGAMAALLGADIEKAQALADAAAEGEVCTVANDNDPTQVVLSGHAGAIERAIGMVKDHGIKRGVALPVSAPFHCPLMQPAADAMAQALAQTPPRAFTVPVFANVTAAAVSDPAEEQRLLVEQVTGRVRWRESAIAMGEAGVTHFVELGGKVVAPMIKRSAGDVETTSVVTMEDIEALLAQF
jgi:[acyl-carrier-protein] S-malonyltransferase